MFFGIFYTTIQPLPLLLSPPKEPFSSCHFFPFLWASKTVACLLHVCGRGQESESHGKLFTVTKNSGAMCVCKSLRVFDDSAKLIALFKQVHRYIFYSSKKNLFIHLFIRSSVCCGGFPFVTVHLWSQRATWQDWVLSFHHVGLG